MPTDTIHHRTPISAVTHTLYSLKISCLRESRAECGVCVCVISNLLLEFLKCVMMQVGRTSVGWVMPDFQLRPFHHVTAERNKNSGQSWNGTLDTGIMEKDGHCHSLLLSVSRRQSWATDKKDRERERGTLSDGTRSSIFQPAASHRLRGTGSVITQVTG